MKNLNGNTILCFKKKYKKSLVRIWQPQKKVKYSHSKSLSAPRKLIYLIKIAKNLPNKIQKNQIFLIKNLFNFCNFFSNCYSLY